MPHSRDPSWIGECLESCKRKDKRSDLDMSRKRKSDEAETQALIASMSLEDMRKLADTLHDDKKVLGFSLMGIPLPVWDWWRDQAQWAALGEFHEPRFIDEHEKVSEIAASMLYGEIDLVEKLGPARRTLYDINRKVTCFVCTRKFHDAIDGSDGASNQGIGCDASVHQLQDGSWIILGSYGSDFDLYLFEFLPRGSYPPPLVAMADPICDDCIRRLVQSRQVRFVRQLTIAEAGDLKLVARPPRDQESRPT